MADSAAEKAELQVVSTPAIEKRIFVVRERQVMIDEDLANLYGVETRILVQQVKRNAFTEAAVGSADSEGESCWK
jgi:hypothetical protein